MRDNHVMKIFPIAAVAALLAGSAHAAVVAGVGVEIKPASGKGQLCLDASHDRKTGGLPVLVTQCRGVEAQRWTVTTSADNHPAIIGEDGFCLDVKGGSSRANGVPLQLFRCDFGDSERFALTPDGHIREDKYDKCLVATGVKDSSPVVIDSCSNAPDEVLTAAK